MDLPRLAAAGRVRQRHLGRRLLELHRQHLGLGAALGRFRTRPRLHPHRHPVQRLLRRRSPRRQPLRHEHDRPQRGDRRARLALPVGASRHLELRQSQRAQGGGHHRRRATDSGGRGDDQARLGLRLQPGDRRAGVAHRGTARAGLRHSRRADIADAALCHQTGGFRETRNHRGRPHRLHARVASAGARDRAAVPDGGHFYATVSLRGTGRHERHLRRAGR